jgi:ectoine hydroxylase-related dioxygenase (phytanoyl-CoA dioxygenase family)
MPSIMTQAQLDAFNRDGFVIVPGMFDREEVALLQKAMELDPAVRDHMIDRADAKGAATRISLWNRAGDSVYGLAARCHRMVDTMETLLGGPVYHFQSKLTAKESRVGGAWEWHQDYGYWYYNGCLFPRLASCMIALDPTRRENGCLKMVKSSHLMGRIDHVPVPGEGQNVADPARMKHILAACETVYCEMEPGDGLFFHGNTLHSSEQNLSEKRRWTLLCCYNRVDNDTFKRDDDRYYVPLEKVPDEAIKAAGLKFSDGVEEHFASKAFVPKVGTAAE